MPPQQYPPAAPQYTQQTVVHHVQQRPVNDTCCLCIPIHCGMTVLGIFSILGLIGAIINCFGPQRAATHNYLAISANAIAAVAFIRWFSEDTKSTRNQIHRHMIIALILNLIGGVTFIATVPISSGLPKSQVNGIYSGAIGTVVIGALINLYYISVARRFADQYGAGKEGFTQMTTTTHQM